MLVPELDRRKIDGDDIVAAEVGGGAGAGGFHYEIADIMDDPGGFSERNEGGGRNPAMQRVAPARQRLKPRKAEIARPEDGLVFQADFAARDRSAQILPQCRRGGLRGHVQSRAIEVAKRQYALRDLGLFGGLGFGFGGLKFGMAEHAEDSAFSLRRAPQREICGVQQALRVNRMVGVDGHAHRGADFHRLVPDGEGLGERVFQLRGQRLSAVGRAVMRLQDGEFVAIDTRRHIRLAGEAFDAVGDLTQQFIAAGAANALIQGAQLVDIHQEERCGAAGAVVQFDRGGQGLGKQRAISEAGHGIVMEQQFNPLTIRAGARYISYRGDGGGLAFMRDGLAAQFHVALGLVHGEKGKFADFAGRVFQFRAQAGGLGGGRQRGEMLAEEFGFPVAKETLQ